MTEKLNQADIQAIIKKLDDTRSELLDIKINGYCLWPAVKVVLWRYLTRKHVSDDSFNPKKSITHEKQHRRAYAYFFIALNALFSLFFSFIPNFIKLFTMPRKIVGTILLRQKRTVHSKFHSSFDQYFGTLNVSENKRFVSIYHFPFNSFWQELFKRNVLDETFIRSIVLLFILKEKIFAQKTKQKKLAIQKIHSILKSDKTHCAQLPYELIDAAVNNFLITFKIYKFIFSIIQPKNLIVMDFDSKLGEIAAAKDLGIKIFDLQHGTFWSDDLDHSWSAHSKKHKPALPVPDFLLLRGNLWKEIALEKGFWGAEELICTGCATMSKYMAYRKPPKKVLLANKRLNFLFCSGDLKSNDWVTFLDNFLSNFPLGFHLSIKLHPRERLDSHPYKELVTRYSDILTIIPPSSNTSEIILDADILIGSTSTTMIEAIALGVPTFSVSVGATPEGLANAHRNNSFLERMVPHAADLQDLTERIQTFQNSPSLLLKWMEDVERNVNKIYSTNFEKEFEQLFGKH